MSDVEARLELMGELLDAIAETVVAVDLEGRVVYSNGAAKRLFGIDPQAVVSTGELDMDACFELNPTWDEMRLCLQAGVPWSGELTVVRFDGERMPAWVTWSPAAPRDGWPTYMVAVAQDLRERREAEARLSHQALHDPLTGVANRVLFQDRLDHALARSLRDHNRVAVAYVDLDDFKLINDLYGHAAGDDVLRAVAEVLESVTRAGDTVARLGGDEFAIVFDPVLDEDEAATVADRLKRALDGNYGIRGKQLSVTASIGIALSGPSAADSNQLMQDADSALYQAKHRGRAQAQVFTDRLRVDRLRRLHIEEHLPHALERGELSVVFQPAVDLRTLRICGFEALLRWRHPILGSVGPDEFIPIAESHGWIGAMGEWVLAQAVNQLAGWTAWNGCEIQMAVNLSSRQLEDPGFPERVRQIMNAAGVDPSLVCLEITESVVMDDAEAAVEALRALKAIGVQLAIDDFGTGYSSLAYLKRFPVDQLKIDRIFIEGLAAKSEETSIVTAIIDLARSLELGVVAEGVEEVWQLGALQALGCDRAQGFLWSPAVPSEQAARLVYASGLPADAALAVVGEPTASPLVSPPEADDAADAGPDESAGAGSKVGSDSGLALSGGDTLFFGG